MAKILIAEDEPDIRDLITFTLQFGGFEVLATNNGVEAVECALKEKPDLILLDVRMPRMTGYEACAALKKDPATAAIPVAFLSAKGQEAEVKDGLAAGALAYILKPFAPDELIKHVKEMLAAPVTQPVPTDAPTAQPAAASQPVAASTERATSPASADKPDSPASTDKLDSPASTDKLDSPASAGKPDSLASTDKLDSPASADKPDSPASTDKLDSPASADKPDSHEKPALPAGSAHNDKETSAKQTVESDGEGEARAVTGSTEQGSA